MRVYLMRHAAAEESAAGGDAQRRLTEQGRVDAREAGNALRDRNEKVDLILSSPRLRARETAELVAAAIGAPVEVRQELTCGATNEVFWDVLRSEDADKTLLLVAHNPDLGTFVSSLISRVVGFSPATLCCVDPDAGTLLWIRHPHP